jgi:hydrogenase maturation protease
VTDLLVIGYGNDLRSDDGAGRVVAAAITEMDLDGVEVRSVSQLTPELALDVGAARRVVFVDADVEVTEMTVTPVAAGESTRGVMTHHGDPASMLTLAGTVGEVPVEAIVISIPAQNLGLGFELSDTTAAGVEAAIRHIAGLAGSAPGCD